MRTKGINHRAWEKMEAQQVLFGRGVQRLRSVCGGCYVGAKYANRWCRSCFRYGWTYSSAGLAIHSSDREKDSRLAAGCGTSPNQEYTYY